MKTRYLNNIFSMSLRYIALFVVCMVSIIACTKDPVASEPPTIETTEEIIPTEDQVVVTSPLQAYISPNVVNEGFSTALYNRLTNRITSIEGDNAEFLVTMVIHNTDVMNIENDKNLLITSAIQLLFGRNVIIVEPTMDGIKTFSTAMTELFIAFKSDSENMELLEELESEAVPGARLVFEALHEMSQDDSKIESLFAASSDTEGTLAEAFAIRGSTFHIVQRLTKDTTNGVATCEVVDENGESSIIEDFDEMVGIEPVANQGITAYTYGLFADVLTEWINNHEYYMDEYNTRCQGALLDIQRASEDMVSLDQIANLQRVEYTMLVPAPYNVGPGVPVVIRYEVCSVYMEKDNCDYYCIYKTIRSHNQNLKCGPTEADKWKESYYFIINKPDRWGAPVTKVPFYGPFMRDIATKSICYAASDEIADASDTAIILPDATKIPHLSGVNVVDYAPKNSAGSTDYTTGVSYGFDGGLTFGADPALNLGFSLSYDKSTSQTIEDLTIIASTESGVPTWKYVGGNLPGTHWGYKDNTHDTAPAIMREECEVNQSWIWRVQNPSGSYSLYDETSVTTCILSYETSLFRTNEVYNNCEATSRISFLMLPPPRFEQCWIRDVQPYSEEVNNLLGTLHSKYWNPNDYEMRLPDSSVDSTISINQFINDFKRDLKDKKMIWHNRGLVPEGNKYTFSFYKKGTATIETLEFEL